MSVLLEFFFSYKSLSHLAVLQCWCKRGSSTSCCSSNRSHTNKVTICCLAQGMPDFTTIHSLEMWENSAAPLLKESIRDDKIYMSDSKWQLTKFKFLAFYEFENFSVNYINKTLKISAAREHLYCEFTTICIGYLHCLEYQCGCGAEFTHSSFLICNP